MEMYRSNGVASSLCIRLDSSARASLQEQIYGGIRDAILNGVIAPATRLPSSRTLASDLGISRTTVVLAFDRLLAEGYLSPRRGSGTFVASELPGDLPAAPLSSYRGTHYRGQMNHPPLSRRGAVLASTSPAGWRLGGPPRAFRMGTPALDLFPVRLWAQLVNRRLRSVTLGQLDYGDPAGLQPLRNAIAAHVQATRGTTCEARQIVIVAGAQRGLEMICRMLLDVGETAWFEEPGYPGAQSALVTAGAHIVPVRVDEQGLDVQAGMSRAGNARLSYVTPSHQFPLGVPMSLARRLALLRWASRAQAWVLEDDYDSAFRYGTHPIPCLHGLDVDGRVIYIGSFSKTLFPSLRLGFLIAPPDLREPLLAIQRSAPALAPALDQMVVAEFIAEGHYDRHLRRMRSAYRERLDALIDAAERICNGALSLRLVRTGLHAVADLADADAETVCHEALARGVEATPLSAYYSERVNAPNALVLGFGALRADDMVPGMERLAAAIEAARQR
jgi:GntR family transcriptional regulator / MocR family aminotransferase